MGQGAARLEGRHMFRALTLSRFLCGCLGLRTDFQGKALICSFIQPPFMKDPLCALNSDWVQ